ncbi:hypothetical protein KR026_009510, partial [Drosophila bipectinata]
MLYAAPVCADAAKTSSYTKGLTSTYRLFALRVCSGYRTISDDAALVIAGMVPIGLLAAERQELYQALVAMNGQTPAATRRRLKESSRATSIQKGQQRWDESTKGRWTHQLVPDLKNVVLDCPRFSIARRRLLGEVVTADLIGRRLLEDGQFWAGMSRFAAYTMKELRRLERLR